jgi:hypothetical protein
VVTASFRKHMPEIITSQFDIMLYVYEMGNDLRRSVETGRGSEGSFMNLVIEGYRPTC